MRRVLSCGLRRPRAACASTSAARPPPPSSPPRAGAFSASFGAGASATGGAGAGSGPAGHAGYAGAGLNAWGSPPKPPSLYGLADGGGWGGWSSRGAAGAKPSAAEMPAVYAIRAAHLLRLRFHVGHAARSMARPAAGALAGFRHGVAVFDPAASWRSLRALFYAFAEMAAMRSSFFLLAPNSALPMQKLVERMRRRYPFSHGRFSSLYMLGYADAKYIDGTISNWKQTYAFYEHVQRVLAAKPSLAKFRRLQRYLRGVEGVDLMARVAPDFILVFAADRGAAHEAANADIPLVGMADSDVSPAPFLYPVFGNDDSVASVAFMVDLLSRAVEEGRKREHEAFASLLLAKVKERLAAGAPAPPPPDGDFDAPDADDAALEAKLRAAAAPSILARRERVAQEAAARRQPGARAGDLPRARDVEPPG